MRRELRAEREEEEITLSARDAREELESAGYAGRKVKATSHVIACTLIDMG